MNNNVRRNQAPPYAKRLNGSRNLVVIMGGHEAWNIAKRHLDMKRDAIVIPMGRHPNEFQWRCALQRSIVVLELSNTGPGYRDSVIRALAIAGAKEVFLLACSRKPCDCLKWGLA